MMKIGIYGGSFNPVHLGHLHLLQEVKAQCDLDRILVMPAGIPPHKAAPDLAPGKDRAEMLRLALSGADGIEVCSYELEQQGKSYTYLTLREFTARQPEDTFFLIMGADMLLSFDQWRNWQEILQNAHLIAAARDEGEYAALLRKAEKLGGTTVLQMTPWPCSSTDVRSAVKAGAPITGMVPEAVAAYIEEHRLYR
jgi:nicotinate-nucleotide adenylyltransferase